MNLKIFWPNRRSYLLIFTMIGIFIISYFIWKNNSDTPNFAIVATVLTPLIIFYIFWAYSRRILIDDEFVIGIWKGGKIKIPRNEVLVKFDLKEPFERYAIIMDKRSYKQIKISYCYFSKDSIDQIKQILGTNEIT